MAQFSTPLSIEGESRPLYQVTVNDGGSDGGTNTSLMIGGFPAALDHAAADTAVRAFADAFAEAAGYTIVGISRLAVTETTL